MKPLPHNRFRLSAYRFFRRFSGPILAYRLTRLGL